MAKRMPLVAGLDLGTWKTCVLVGNVTEHGIAVSGFGTAQSRGLRKGVVVHVESTVAAIRKAVAEAEAMAGCEIRHVVASVGGAHVRGLTSHGVVAVRNGEISDGDVNRVLDAAGAVALPAEREVLHVLPQEFIIDEQEGIKEPLGITGVRLEAKVHIVTAQMSAAQNLVKCCKHAGLAVDDVVLGPLASADAVLTPEEKDLGVALVDVGGGTTDLVIFHGGAVKHTAVLPLGGGHLTNDIAAGLRTPTVEAEKIKHRFGCARAANVPRHVSIEVPSVGDREPAHPLAPHPLRDHRAAGRGDLHLGEPRDHPIGVRGIPRFGRRPHRRHGVARQRRRGGRADLRICRSGSACRST